MIQTILKIWHNLSDNIGGAKFIVQPAPPLGNNPGGRIEIVTDQNSVTIGSFNMP